MNEISSVPASGIPEVQAAETMPHSIEAEQQLLGAILTNNDVYDLLERGSIPCRRASTCTDTE